MIDLLELMFLWFTADTKIDWLQAASVGDCGVCTYFEELLDDALVVDPSCQIQGGVTRHIWGIDNLVHEFR